MAVAINGAESNRASVRYIIENIGWGTTPPTGLTREMRITSSGMVASKDTQISDELRADRMVPSIVEVAASSGGPVSWEFSAFSQDDLFQHSLLGIWTRPMLGILVKGSSVNVTDIDEVTLSGADWSKWIVPGRFIKLEGYNNLANNSYFEVVSATFTGGNTIVVVAESTLVVEAGSAFTKLSEGNDVILKSDLTAFAAGNVISGGGANAFAGERLYVGQKIRLEGLGRESGTIQCAATDPVQGALITINDGVETVVYEIRTDAGLVAEGNIHVPHSGTPATLAANLRAAIMGEFNRKNSHVFASVTTDTVTVFNGRNFGGSVTTSDAVGLTVTNFAGGDATKNGFFTIASLPDDDTIVTVEPLSIDTNAGGATVLVLGSHLRNPGILAEITRQSMSIETGFTDVSKYFLMNGQRASGFSFTVEAGDIVTGETTFMGRETIRTSVPKLGAAPYDVLATTNTEVLNATANVGQVIKNGVTLTKAIRSIEMEVEANLRNQPAVGSKFPAGIGYGRLNISGTVEAYFEDFEFYDHFIEHETVSLGFSFTDVDYHQYFFTLPALKFSSDDIAPEGIDTDVMEPLEFTAQRDPVLNTEIMIDRFSSTFPSTVA
jgi:hypothetical protein